MRNVLTTDIKNNIRSIRFILGIFLIVSATLMSEHEMLQKIINAGGSAEGPGWFVAYTYCMNSVNMLLFVPIAVAFAGGENTEAELHSRFFLFSYIRSGRKQYLVGKAAGLLVSGGLTAFLAMVFLLVICGQNGGKLSEIVFKWRFLGANWRYVGCHNKKSLYVLCRSFYSLLCPDRISGALLSKSILSESPLLGGVYLLQ